MILSVALAALALNPAQLPLPILPPLPPPPPLCLEPPLPPICVVPPPPPGDDPPTMGRLALRRDGRYVVLTWRAATDDVGVWGYRIYRDGNYLRRLPAQSRRARVALPCGAHRFRVEVVDTAEQTDSRIAHAVRRCTSN